MTLICSRLEKTESLFQTYFSQYTSSPSEAQLDGGIIFNFVDTPRNFIIAKLSIRKPGSSSVLIKSDFISTDEDPGLRFESFAIIKLRGVSTKLNIIFFYFFTMQTFKKLIRWR